MPIGLVSSNAASISSASGEVTVVTDSHGGMFVAYADANALTAGKTLNGRLYSKVRSASALVRAVVASATGVIVDPNPRIIRVGPIVTTEQVDLRLQTDEASAQSFPWRLNRLAQLAFSAEGDATPTVGGAEVVLWTDTIAGVWILLVDLSLMQAGDTVELRLKTRIRPTDTVRLCQPVVSRSGAQSNPAWVVLEELAHDYIEATLKQTAGTARTFAWKLVRLA